MSKNIPFQEFELWGEELEFVSRALSSKWVSSGEYVLKLESEFRETYNLGYTLAVSNGTSALHMAYAALGVASGDEIIVPAFGYLAGANIAVQFGATPVFADISRHHWNATAVDIERRISPRTKAVVVVHNYGLSGDIEEIARLCTAHQIPLIEDCAEAIMSRKGQAYLGSFGDISTWSLHATKTISSGEGGIVSCKDASVYDAMKLLRSHGMRREGKHYWHESFGHNFRLSNVLAAIGYAQFRSREIILQEKRRVMALYRSLLGKTAHMRCQSIINGLDPVPWAMAVQLTNGRVVGERDNIIDKLLSQYSIETRPGFYTPAQLPIYANICSNENKVADLIAESTIVLPSSPKLTTDEIKYVCNALVSTVEGIAGESQSFLYLSSDDKAHERKLNAFLESMGKGKDSFRYFESRPFSVLENHIVTLLLIVDGEAVAYGHLDLEGVVWLGVAVRDSSTGRGYGEIVVNKLIDKAIESAIDSIFLRVDLENRAARGLYEKIGFVYSEHGETSAKMVYKTGPEQPLESP